MVQRLVAYSYAKLVFWLDHEGLKADITEEDLDVKFELLECFPFLVTVQCP